HRTASFASTSHRFASSLFSPTTISFSATLPCILFILVDYHIVERGKGGKVMQHRCLTSFFFLLFNRIALPLLRSC
ncbi:unnamed protein product, partial [Musa banksii]